MNATKQTLRTILVVDKDPLALASMSAILEDAGYAIHIASDGKNCTDSVCYLKPALILMDADHIEDCRRLKNDQTLGAIPVMLMIAESDSRVIEDFHRSCADDIVRKPLNGMELLWRINRLLKPQPSKDGQNQIQKLQNVLETAAEVCHTLNQPLQYVMGTVQFLLMDMPPEDKLFSRLDMIRQKAELMGDITRELTALTRHGAKT
jgi:DNA-binding response OmpR family regulator